MAAAADREVCGLRGQVWELKAKISELWALLEAQQQVGEQAAAAGRAEGWRAGFAAGHAAGLADVAPPPPPARGERWLRTARAPA